MVDLAAAKAFCRVDHSDDDTVLAAMIAAASDHLTSIGVDMSSSTPPAVDMAVLMLTAFFYDHREDAGAAPGGVVDRLIQPYREVHL